MRTDSEAFGRFSNALKKGLTVSHEEMKAVLDAEKREKKQHPKRTSDRVSSDKD